MVNQVDWAETYTNCAAAFLLGAAKTPVVLETEREAILMAVRTCTRTTPENARIVRIRNTLALEEFLVSEPLWSEARLEAVGPWSDVHFDSDQNLE
jgi:hypothetical protein